MPKQLEQNFAKANSIPLQVIADPGDLEGAAIDTYDSGGLPQFDTALAMIEIGLITGTPTKVEISVEEADDSAFASPTIAEGGALAEVTAEHSYLMQIKRTKRYLRVVVETTAGTTPTVEAFAALLLFNAQKPFPCLTATEVDNS